MKRALEGCDTVVSLLYYESGWRSAHPRHTRETRTVQPEGDKRPIASVDKYQPEIELTGYCFSERSVWEQPQSNAREPMRLLRREASKPTERDRHSLKTPANQYVADGLGLWASTRDD